MVYSAPRAKRLSVTGLSLSPSTHFLTTMIKKGFSAERVKACFDSPTKVYASKSHPGQTRVINGDLCVVGRIEGKSFVAITVYLDGVVTEVRADQMNTESGRRFAKIGRQ